MTCGCGDDSVVDAAQDVADTTPISKAQVEESLKCLQDLADKEAFTGEEAFKCAPDTIDIDNINTEMIMKHLGHLEGDSGQLASVFKTESNSDAAKEIIECVMDSRGEDYAACLESILNDEDIMDEIEKAMPDKQLSNKDIVSMAQPILQQIRTTGEALWLLELGKQQRSEMSDEDGKFFDEMLRDMDLEEDNAKDEDEPSSAQTESGTTLDLTNESEPWYKTGNFVDPDSPGWNSRLVDAFKCATDKDITPEFSDATETCFLQLNALTDPDYALLGINDLDPGRFIFFLGDVVAADNVTFDTVIEEATKMLKDAPEVLEQVASG